MATQVEYSVSVELIYVAKMEFGTTSVQLRERKNGLLVPKRHKMKHLDFLILLLESRRSVVQNPSRPSALGDSQLPCPGLSDLL
jgi:hypothetical protein